MNCTQWDLAVITKDGIHTGVEVFILEKTKAPHVHVSGLPSWYVEIQGEPVLCTAPDGTKVPTLNCHIPDEWLKPIESFDCKEPS